jgi:glycosyltransferase involved in cell wall biosynthesis
MQAANHACSRPSFDREDLLCYHRLPPGKIRVVSLGVDPVFFGLRRAPEEFLLTVSTLHPHKGLDGLLRRSPASGSSGRTSG